MKKLILVSLGLIMAMGLNAQENKMWIGGNAGFGTNNVKDGDSFSSWKFGPTFAYMLDEKMAVGINILSNGSTDKQNNNDNDTYTMSGWNIEPFFRYYFAGAGNFKFFGDGLVGFGGGNEKWDNDIVSEPFESKYSTFGIWVRPGAQFWFNDNWSMAATIGALGYSSKTSNKGETNNAGESIETTTTNFGIAVDFSNTKFSVFWHF